MKLFSLEEANALLPEASRIVEGIVRLHARVLRFRNQSATAAKSADLGGGHMQQGLEYVSLLMELAQQNQELSTLGIQLKDHSRGLIDFPSMREGRIVLLCWQLGEGDKIEWWHDLEAGFAGRQPL